jgi:hypothetical protein
MARDVAQRDRDQANFRIENLGNPQAANDATKTDNTSVPLPSAGAGSPGSSFLAAPADHVHPATPGNTIGMVMSFSHPDEQELTGPIETLLGEWAVDFTQFPPGDLIVTFAATVQVDAGTAEFDVHIGTHPGEIVEPHVSTIQTTSSTFEVRSETARFTPPAGLGLVQITGGNNDATFTCRIKSKSIIIRPAT